MDCGINCLIREYENVQKISTDILIDIFFNIGVIRFLFSGLVFSIAQNSREVPLVAFSHRQGFTTATKLLNFLLLFTKIVNNPRLNTLVAELKKEKCGDGSSASLNEYRLRVLKLLQALQASHHNCVEPDLLDYLLPLLHSHHSLVSCDIELL